MTESAALLDVVYWVWRLHSKLVPTSDEKMYLGFEIFVPLVVLVSKIDIEVPFKKR